MSGTLGWLSITHARALVLGLAGVILACAGPATTPRQSLTVPADTLPPSPQEHQAWALEHVLPKRVLGLEYTSSSYAGQDAMSLMDSNGLYVGSSCREIGDFSVARSMPNVRVSEGGPLGAGEGVLSVYRVAGADRASMQGTFVELAKFVAEDQPTVEQVSIGGRDLVRVRFMEYGEPRAITAYAVGELLFELTGDAAWLEDVLQQLPVPDTDTSALGAPVGPEPASCIGPSDPQLEAMLPWQLGEVTLRHLRITYYALHPENPDVSLGKFAALSGATKENFIGYVLGANLGWALGAFRVAGASRQALEAACAPLVYANPERLHRSSMAGKDVLVVSEPDEPRAVRAGCYIRGDVLFWIFGGPVAGFFGELP